MRISDWSSDVCSSDLDRGEHEQGHDRVGHAAAVSPASQICHLAYGQFRRLRLKRAHRFLLRRRRRAMRIAIASDHAAYELKALLADWLRGEGHEVADLGTDGPDSVDYPDYGYRLAEAIASGSAERGGALCRSEEHTSDLPSLMP